MKPAAVAAVARSLRFGFDHQLVLPVRLLVEIEKQGEEYDGV